MDSIYHKCAVKQCERPTHGRALYCAAHLWRINTTGNPGAAEIQAPRHVGPRATKQPCVQLECEECHKHFSVSYSIAYKNGVLSRKFCSMECRRNATRIAPLNCQQCGKEFWVKPSKSGFYRKAKFCSKSCAYESYRKPIRSDSNGYAITTVNGRDVYLHRQEMENHLSRKLLPDETVHHKDGDRMNWHISNLELWSSRHGKGQRVSDRIESATAFLKEYGIEVNHLSHADAAFGCMSMSF